MNKSLTIGIVLLYVMSTKAALTVVDLTYELGNDTIYWPGGPPFAFNVIARGNQSEGFWLEMNEFSTPEHGGTHVDAPSHFAENQPRVEQIPVSSLVGPAVVVDVQAKASVDNDYRLTKQDLMDWETKYGRIPDRAVVIMNSGWGSRYPSGATKVFNTDDPTDPSTFHFPTIHLEAAVFLADERRVIAIGVDTPSVDSGQAKTFDTHRAMGARRVLGIENVANVGALPPRGSTVIIGVVKLRQGSGGPARVLGLVGGSLENCEVWEFWGWLGWGKGEGGSGGVGGGNGRAFLFMAVVVVLMAVACFVVGLGRRLIRHERQKEQ